MPLNYTCYAIIEAVHKDKFMGVYSIKYFV